MPIWNCHCTNSSWLDRHFVFFTKLSPVQGVIVLPTPKNALFQGTPVKITIHLHCLIHIKWVIEWPPCSLQPISFWWFFLASELWFFVKAVFNSSCTFQVGWVRPKVSKNSSTSVDSLISWISWKSCAWNILLDKWKVKIHTDRYTPVN